MKNQDNFACLLEIFNKLIKFDAFSFIRQPLTRLIISSPDFITTFDKMNYKDLIRTLSTQKLIWNLIWTKSMKYMRMFLKTYFNFKEMILHIENSIMKIDEFEQNNNDTDLKEFEDLRDVQYINLISIFNQIYLNSKYSDSDKELISKEFSDKISHQYIEMLNDFWSNTDFSNINGISKSKLRFFDDLYAVFYF